MFTTNHCDQILMHCGQYTPNNLVNMAEKTWKPIIEIAPNCPRCASSNTKFCYYNNYSLSQPRYFCKGCRRYWTKGGSLRNVPVGGGCRKNRRAKAVKLPHHDRSSSSINGTYNSNQGQDVKNSKSTGGADIDLALVFANFLSPSSNIVDHEQKQDLSGTNTNSSSDNYFSPNDNIGIAEEVQTQPNIGEDQLVMGNNYNDDMNIGDFELQNMGLNDAFWSDTEAMSSFNSWQLQDVDLFPNGHDDDRLQISTNENWSSCDFSGFEVFSRS